MKRAFERIYLDKFVVDKLNQTVEMKPIVKAKGKKKKTKTRVQKQVKANGDWGL